MWPLDSDFILKHWLVPSQTSGELVLPIGDGHVAPISRDEVAAAVAAVAAKPNKSCIIYVIRDIERWALARSPPLMVNRS